MQSLSFCSVPLHVVVFVQLLPFSALLLSSVAEQSCLFAGFPLSGIINSSRSILENACVALVGRASEVLGKC